MLIRGKALSNFTLLLITNIQCYEYNTVLLGDLLREYLDDDPALERFDSTRSQGFIWKQHIF